jgi:hypothetical protein
MLILLALDIIACKEARDGDIMIRNNAEVHEDHIYDIYTL